MFRVGLTNDFLRADGSQAFPDIDTSALDVSGVAWACLCEAGAGDELPPTQMDDLDAVLVLGPQVTDRTLETADRLAVVARLGVGYDSVDIDACTQLGVAVTITPDGVRRPVASAALAFLLALAHKMPLKDRLLRQGRWSEKADHMGTGLRGRTLGLVGLGSIGQEICRLVSPHQMNIIAFDPYASDTAATELGASLLGLDELLEAADFIVVCCALTEETHHLIGVAQLERMKPQAQVINVARGPIIDQAALTAALGTGGIAGAALDVFEREPVDANDPLLGFDNVILSPHALAWTDESFRMMGESAFRAILEISCGRAPENVVNSEVLDSTLFQQRLAASARRRSDSQEGN
ncbi:MAG TPA: NAD(P)-dependent oxidoreductase [Candidatus Latescibacteria bacterium]|nr:dehydrogenase [Gemmatimonadaceae bacterium]HJP32245.1 NAD(P)-dependent oxidoreductase [Candidatus Latescibacterota bacterium]|tara:strand:- start:303 stop:1358 length:1056 start_codon:yes stop_codon:yes gene_type:complete